MYSIEMWFPRGVGERTRLQAERSGFNNKSLSPKLFQIISNIFKALNQFSFIHYIGYQIKSIVCIF